MIAIPEREIRWMPCYRIIANLYPPVNFFETVASDPSDWEMLIEVARMTDPSFDVGAVASLDILDRVSGPGASRILPSFTFPDVRGSRFNTMNFGAFYAASSVDTAIAETIHHRTIFMTATSEPAQDLDNVLILVDLNGLLNDIRSMQSELPEIYHQTDYQHSQRLAQSLRSQGSCGLAYTSVRNAPGECVAVWRARVLSNARDDRNITYRWDGTRISGYFDKSQYKQL